VTLPASGSISLHEIAAEFSLAQTAIFPSAFYGKGGAPASGALSFADFYGRSAAVVVVSVAPTSQNTSGTTASKTFAPSTITVTGGTPTAYAWSILNVAGGSWVISSGQGTATAVAQVSGAVATEPVDCDLQCDVTVGGLHYYATSHHTYTRS
jgi:hypothetical protein